MFKEPKEVNTVDFIIAFQVFREQGGGFGAITSSVVLFFFLFFKQVKGQNFILAWEHLEVTPFFVDSLNKTFDKW